MNMHTPTKYPCHSTENMMDESRWRPAVGIFITNPKNEILIGLDSRFQNGAARKTGWIIPQGGIDDGETPLEAAKREAMEETGLNVSSLTFCQQHPKWLTYEPWATGYAPDGRLGSQLRWFHFKTDTLDLPTPDMEEFVQFAWMGLNSMMSSTHMCRHEMYRKVITEFLGYPPMKFH